MTENLSSCGQIVKSNDSDKFLLSLFAPNLCREALWALFAFNHEIAKTREVVSETQLGLIRLQWWREEIRKLYDGQEVPAHDVLAALLKAIQAYDLPRDHFEALLYAREFDLEDVLPSTLEGMVNYADFTVTPLLKLAVQIGGGDPDIEPVQPVAVNYALIGLLRSVPFHTGQRRCYLPEDLLRAQGIGLNELYEFKAQDKLKVVIEDVMQAVVKGIQPQSRFLKAVQGLAMIYAQQIRRARYDVFHPRISLPPAFKEIRLLFSVVFSL